MSSDDSAERIDDRFTIRVPSGTSIDLITKTNREGTGVMPDVRIAADQALDVAHRLTAEQIAKARSGG